MLRKLIDVVNQLAVDVELLDEYRNVCRLALIHDTFNPLYFALAAVRAGFRTNYNPVNAGHRKFVFSI
jgi:hypothetical protein